MAEKVFMERRDIVLRGDHRDFMLPVQYTRAVLLWCRKNKVDVERPLKDDHGILAREYFGMELWRIRDEQQRMWFALKWS